MDDIDRLSRKVLIDELRTLRAVNKHLVAALAEIASKRRKRDKLVRDHAYIAATKHRRVRI